jgi:hypothetical protein
MAASAVPSAETHDQTAVRTTLDKYLGYLPTPEP